MMRVPSAPQIIAPAPPKAQNVPYNQLRQKCDELEKEVERLKGIVDHQHAVILGQQPMMAHLQWEASKWNHFKRILEKEQGASAVAEVESSVQQRMAGLI